MKRVCETVHRDGWIIKVSYDVDDLSAEAYYRRAAERYIALYPSPDLEWADDDPETETVLFPDPGSIDMGGYTEAPPVKVDTVEERNERIWNEIMKAAKG